MICQWINMRKMIKYKLYYSIKGLLSLRADNLFCVDMLTLHYPIVHVRQTQWLKDISDWLLEIEIRCCIVYCMWWQFIMQLIINICSAHTFTVINFLWPSILYVCWNLSYYLSFYWKHNKVFNILILEIFYN